ncbi:hypothetical protein [Arthrobacter polaris]|uniref:hypothetical protein n=1 Tax=Arthrobacter polaris TaxID=2813727 RepID=UPI001F1D2729|nr:hypothetical protein [Arthrobacter polaris]UIK88847.1 hypothetical protein J0916_16420 [Arthrobacter polaris]
MHRAVAEDSGVLAVVLALTGDDGVTCGGLVDALALGLAAVLASVLACVLASTEEDDGETEPVESWGRKRSARRPVPPRLPLQALLLGGVG